MKPVLILANYRTGATEFGSRAALARGCKWFPEPSNSAVPNIKQDFQEALRSGTKFCAKIIVNQLSDPLYENLFETDFEIWCIRRRNLISQIVSYYIGRQTNRWEQLSEKIDDYSVSIDHNEIEYSIKTIISNERQLLRLHDKYDKIFFYEDLALSNPRYRWQFKTTKPTNYEEVYEAILKKLIHYDETE